MRYFLVVLLFLSGCDIFHKTPLTEKPVVDVNGHQLTARQMAEEMVHRLRGQDALTAKDPKSVAALKNKIAQDFIVQQLTDDWAKDHGVIVKAEDLDARIKDVQSSYPDDLSFQQALAEEGLTFKEWRERLQRTLLQQKVVKSVGAAAKSPTDSELKDYYQNHKVEFTAPESAQIRQILVKTESDAKSIEEQLKKHRSMAALAKQYSISPEGEKGGLVGWIEKSSADVFAPAFHMRAGQLSPIFKSAFGYHIFEVVGRKPAHTKAYADVKGDIRRILMEKREQSLYLSWLEEQMRKARVFKDQALIDGMKVETKAK